MSKQIQQKQGYLREKVLEAGYDAQEFVQFCQRRVGGIDIERWSLAELKNLVIEFMQSKKENVESSIQGSSFMEYQQQMEEQKDIDIDMIDVFRNRVQEETIQQVSDAFIKNLGVAGLKHSFSAGEREVNLEQSSIWGPESEAIVNIEDVSQSNKTNLSKQNIAALNQNLDGFGDFSVPFNEQQSQRRQAYNQIVSHPFQTKSSCKPPHVFISPMTKTQSQRQSPQDKQSVFEIAPQSPPQHKSVQRIMLQLKSSAVTFLAHSKLEDNQISSRLHTKSKTQSLKQIKQQFFDNISCVKAKVRSLLADHSLAVQITGHETINRGFVLPSYVVYSVLTKPLNVQVKRKYASFLQLRQVLNKFYPGVRLPYLEKSAWLSQSGVQQIKAQKLIIQGFMNDLLMNREFRNCRILEEFLTLKDRQTLKQKFTQYEKMDHVKSIEQMCLLRGSIDVGYTDQHRIYFQKLTPFLQSIENGIDRYKSLSQKLSSFYSGLIKAYTDIQQVFVGMENNIRIFNQHVKFCQFHDLQKSIKGINDHFRQLNNNVRLEAKFLERDFKNFWNYERNNIGSIKQLLDIRVKVTDYYNKNYIDNPNRHDKYIGNKKLDQFKVGVTEVSKHPAVAKYQMGFYNQCTAEQTMRMFQDMSKKLNNKIIFVTAEMYLSRTRDLSEFYKAQKKLGKVIE